MEQSVGADGGPFEALRDAAAVLALVQRNRHIWLVTDGDIDYCGDGNPLCPVDSAIGQLQRMAAADAPIRTSVFGLAEPESLAASVLQSLANAGAGEPVRLEGNTAPIVPMSIFNQCSGVPRWASDFASTGKIDDGFEAIGTYSASPGSARVHTTVTGDMTPLLNQLRSELTEERPCVLDLTFGYPAGISGYSRLDANARVELVADIMVEGAVRVPYDEQNGWHLVDGYIFHLEGESCTALRAAPNPTLSISWAC